MSKSPESQEHENRLLSQKTRKVAKGAGYAVMVAGAVTTPFMAVLHGTGSDLGDVARLAGEITDYFVDQIQEVVEEEAGDWV